MPTDRYLNALRGSPRPLSTFSRLRKELSPTDYGALAGSLISNSHYAKTLFHPPFPNRFAQLRTFPIVETLGIGQELLWASAVLSHYGDELSAFAKRALAFHHSVLSDKLDDAEDVLDEIEEMYGLSLWLIKSRIALLQTTHGLAKQKEYAASVCAQSEGGGTVGFLSYYASVRNEPAAIPARFRSEVDSRIKELRPGFAAYLKYHLLPDSRFEAPFLAEVLCHEMAGPVIDYFEAVMYVLARTPALGATDATVFLSTVAALADSIDDERLLRIAVSLSGDIDLLNPDSLMEPAIESILGGRYSEAAAQLTVLQSQFPNSGDIFMALSRSAASGDVLQIPERPLVSSLVGKAGRYLSGNREHQAELQGYALNYYGSEVSTAVAALPALEQGFDIAQDACVAATLSASRLPLWAQALSNDEFRVRFSRNALQVSHGTLARSAAGAFVDGHSTVGLASAEAALIIGQLAYEAGRYADSLTAAREVLAGVGLHPFHRRRSVRLECLSLLGLRQDVAAVDIIVNRYFENASYVEVLPIAEAVAANRGARSGDLIRTPAWPILLDLHTQFVSHSTDSDRIFALLRFLDAWKVERPSELERHVGLFNRHQLIYLLRYLCVESILDRSARFDNSKSVLEERSAVCRLLLTLDRANPEPNPAPYHSEIKDLARRLMLRRRMREVEQSKIYVDTDSVRRTLKAEIPDLYARYQELRLARPKAIFTSEVVEEIVRRIQEGQFGNVVALKLPEDTTIDVLVTIATRIRDEYVFSSEHGLNKYLSVRIRHGTLTAYLRKPLEAVHLVTPRLSPTQGYKRNDYWPARISDVEHVHNQIIERLAKFSGAVDELLDETKRWLNVSADGTGEQLFKFVIHPSILKALEREIPVACPFDVFVDIMLAMFDAGLDENLKAVRDSMLNTARPRATALLDDLEKDIERLSADTSELVVAIKSARTELQFAFSRVAEWFHRSSRPSLEPFPIDDAVETGIESAKQLLPGFSARVTCVSNPSTALVSGILFFPIVDVLFIVFENIIRHSQLSQPSAEVDVLLEDAILVVRVENPIDPALDRVALSTRLDKIRKELREEQNALAVTREGGTGLHKLSRILAHEFEATLDLTFELAASGAFVVKFTAPVKVVLK